MQQAAELLTNMESELKGIEEPKIEINFEETQENDLERIYPQCKLWLQVQAIRGYSFSTASEEPSIPEFIIK